ncbi:MAG: patatin-like phospholipase family protein [Bacteroidaceae bacterium]|nr:patatin-like phospholipase family protein [Bacteroidaceae bacterium]
MEQNKKNVALVLSSGGPRGFAYIGAIEALHQHGYTITSVAGTSMGSLVGGIYAAGKLAEFKEWLYSLDAWEVFSLMDLSIGKNHFVKGEKVIEAMMQIVPNVNIEDLSIPYRAVATDLYTGREVVFDRGPLFSAIRASISIPSLFRPVRYGLTTLIDGAIANCLPLNRVPRTEGDMLVAFDVNDVDEAEISHLLHQEHEARLVDERFEQEVHEELLDVLHDFKNDTDMSFLKRLKHAGSRSMALLKDVLNYRKAFHEDDSLEVGENYYDLLDRTFSLMNHRNTELMLELCRPDVLVKMPFDSYGDISDYAKAREISDRGHQLMCEALANYGLPEIQNSDDALK